MILKKVKKENLSEIAEYMVSMNRFPEMKCAYIGTDHEEVFTYLEEIYEENKTRFFYVEFDDQLVGVIAGDICEDNHSIEVIGPFVSCNLENRCECARVLIKAVIGVLPDYRYSFYIDCANVFVAEIVLSMKGKKHGEHYLMSLELPRDRKKQLHSTRKCIRYQESNSEQESVKVQIEALHDQLFPTAYYNGKTILEHTDDQHWIVYCMDANKVASYAYFNAEEEGYLDFIGTDQNYRRLGYATALLEYIADYLKQKDCSKIELCVSDKDKEAIQLYQLFGFHVEEKNQAFEISNL